MSAAHQVVSPILYQHEDSRMGLASSAELADFTIGDPGWHRVPLDEVRMDDPDAGLVTASAYADLWEEEKAKTARLRDILQQALQLIDSLDNFTPQTATLADGLRAVMAR